MRKYFLALVVLFSGVGCDSSDDGNENTTPATLDMAVVADAEIEPRPDPLPLPAPGVWETVRPGGETLCSRGTEFRFYLRGGDPAKVLVYFQGGGACWDDITCSIADSIFSDAVYEPEDLNDIADAFNAGVFSTEENSPYKDYTFLYIPYCTGDVHWGDATVEYANELTIHHRGYQNTKAALEYLYARIYDPEEIFVTGCSAGAYGAILNSVFIAENYTNSRLAVLADSGSGIITDSFLADSFPGWNALAHLPPYLTRLQEPLETLTIKDVYMSIAETFPQHRFAQYTTAFDNSQTFFYEAMVGLFYEWSPIQEQFLKELDRDLDNYSIYLAPGPLHCISAYPFFLEREMQGVRYADWQRQLIAGDTMPESLFCEGLECFDDPFCVQCEENDGGPGCGFCQSWPGRYETQRAEAEAAAAEPAENDGM